jgi:hypothetical protein
VSSLNGAAGPMTLEQAHAAVAARMEQVFTEANRRLESEGKKPLTTYKPHLVNTCSRPVLLKP